MRILVTGGAGFIGSYILDKLLAEPKNEVVVFDTTSGQSGEMSRIRKQNPKRFFWAQGDITTRKALDAVIRQYEIQQVVHLAFMLPEPSAKDVSMAIRVNGEGTNNIFAASLQADVQKVVWASSINVFGSPEDYKEEILSANARFNPHSIYGACKAFDEFLGAYYQKLGLNVIGLRFCLVYGPSRGRIKKTDYNFINEFIEKAVKSKEWVSVPYAEEFFNFLYLEDAARAVMLALGENGKAGTYTICGEYRSVRDMAGCVKKMIPDANICMQSMHYGLCWLHDMKPALEGIGYFPKYNMESGIQQYIRWLMRQSAGSLAQHQKKRGGTHGEA